MKQKKHENLISCNQNAESAVHSEIVVSFWFSFRSSLVRIQLTPILCTVTWTKHAISKGFFQTTGNCIIRIHRYKRIVTCSEPGFYQNQCGLIATWTTTNNHPSHFKHNKTIFIQASVFENVVCKMATISFGLNLLSCRWLQTTAFTTSRGQ